MNRIIFSASVCLALASTTVSTTAHAQGAEVALIPQTGAEQAGLVRAWFVQTPLDATRSKITHVNLQSGLLLVVTDEGMLHVLDPETGARQWSFPVGDRRFVAQSAGANANYVAVANNIRLYLLDRANGNLVFDHLLTGTPDRGPVLTDDHLLLPIVKGPIESYPLKEDFKQFLNPDYLPSAGRLIGVPAVAPAGLVWTGDSGVLIGKQFSADGPQFNVPIGATPGSGPALFAPRAYVGTETGYVIAYDVRNGDELWRFAAGSAVHHLPVALGSVVYVLPEDGGMFALRPETGETLWYSTEPVQFVAASPQRVYAVDKLKQLAILDAKTGARVDTLRLPHNVHPLLNDRSDRILLYTDDGLIQSLHEAQLTQPHLYLPPKPEEPKKKSGAEKPAAAPAAAGNG